MAQIEALQNPYLVLNICEHLQDNLGSLKSASQLNQTWFAEVIKVLWRQPPVKALASLPAERRELYSIRVHKLVFREDDLPYHRSIKNSCFPRLRSIVMDMTRATAYKDYWPSNYLQGSLQELELDRPTIPKYFFHRLNQCPRLHTLRFGAPSLTDSRRYAHSGNFARFLKGCKSLRSLSLEDNDHLSDRVFFGIAGHETLATLDLHATVGCVLWEKLLRSEIATFRSLREIHLTVPPAAVRLLVRCFNPNRLHILHLNLESDSIVRYIVHEPERQNVLQHIATLSGLELLRVHFKDGCASQALSLAELFSIRSLKLTSLSLHATKAKALDLTDDHFDTWISSFPNLRMFAFSPENALSTFAVCLLAKHGRRLQYCHLASSLDLQGLSPFQIVAFPKLQSLTLLSAMPVTAAK